MSADNSCGDGVNWGAGPFGPYESAAIDLDKQEIEELKREILRMKVYMQSQELDALTEKLTRNNNPTLKDAWDKYQSVLRLSKK